MRAGLIGVLGSPRLATNATGPLTPAEASAEPWRNNTGGVQMTRLWSAVAIGAVLATSAASPAMAKLNSCDGPIVLGTTISVTGIFSSLAGRWDKMTESFEKELNKSGGVFLSSCNKKL